MSNWFPRVQGHLKDLECGEIDSEGTAAFFRDHYKSNTPGIFTLEPWPALQWTLEGLVHKVGHREVEVQVNRLQDNNYEMNAPQHRGKMPFGRFVEQMLVGDNDLYMTAQNSDKNQEALANLWPDVGPLMGCLSPHPETGFIWLGKNTMTPTHHDLTNNLMCQVMGSKIVRMFPPSERDRLEPGPGVHSALGWIDDNMARERGIKVSEVLLEPGHALFLPVGWYHCVQALGVALTIVYTNFRWTNYWGQV